MPSTRRQGSPHAPVRRHGLVAAENRQGIRHVPTRRQSVDGRIPAGGRAGRPVQVELDALEIPTCAARPVRGRDSPTTGNPTVSGISVTHLNYGLGQQTPLRRWRATLFAISALFSSLFRPFSPKYVVLQRVPHASKRENSPAQVCKPSVAGVEITSSRSRRSAPRGLCRAGPSQAAVVLLPNCDGRVGTREVSVEWRVYADVRSMDWQACGCGSGRRRR
jgi:hypothetical protein